LEGINLDDEAEPKTFYHGTDVEGKLKIGDWNVFHNDMLLMAEDYLLIGHNCWFGQNSILDGAGGLEIGNGVRVGMYSQIWTHIASGEQIEGCVFYSRRKTTIKDNVWLVGSCVVGSGVVLGERSTFLINSVVTKDSLADKLYSGNPAKIMDNITVYLAKTIEEKFEMLTNWIREFVDANSKDYQLEVNADEILLKNLGNDENVIFTKSHIKIEDKSLSVFYLADKTFNKTNSLTERSVYNFLYGNKARFLPV
jgi:acetyltransferase-like isoleucine patch superfamily enzyme